MTSVADMRERERQLGNCVCVGICEGMLVYEEKEDENVRREKDSAAMSEKRE